MSIDQRTFRKVLGCFASGVTVVTTVNPENGAKVGVTVSAFSSLSLEPPLVLFCLGEKTASLEAFKANGHFCINILAEDQRDMSIRFASKAEDKFQGLDTTSGQSGVPVLPGCIATLECRLTEMVKGGDHWIFIGEVINLAHEEGGAPLVYFRGAYMDPPTLG